MLPFLYSHEYKIFSFVSTIKQSNHIPMNYRKYILIVTIVLGLFKSYAQKEKVTYVKGNAASILLVMPHIGIETSLGKKSTFQIDVIGSFWESFKGGPLKFCMITPEYRYYFKKRFHGFYAGVHLTGTTFKVSKYFRSSVTYEQGFGYSPGITMGIQKKLSDKFNIDFFIGGGPHQAFYKGYNKNTGERTDGAERYNKSGEKLPYRGGVMISYKLG